VTEKKIKNIFSLCSFCSFFMFWFFYIGGIKINGKNKKNNKLSMPCHHHYKKSMIYWRPEALYNREKPSQKSHLLAAYWRPSSVTKCSVGTLTDDLSCLEKKWRNLLAKITVNTPQRSRLHIDQFIDGPSCQ
jgi:hypothetical protein